MLTSVRNACELHEKALSLQASEAVVSFDEVTADSAKGREFFETTYMTEGLRALLRGAVRRLAGASSDSSFHLKQAMGGGKTHAITALSYLARHADLRDEILPEVPEALGLPEVRFAAFNGRERPGDYFWGRIIRQLEASELLNAEASEPPDEAGWMRVFRKHDRPVLIVMDELPPYFEYLNTVTMGGGTMADRAANAFATMLSAAHRLNNVCVVVSDLAGSYRAGSSIINRALQNAASELKRQEVSITPVNLDSGEAYEILRKRLIRRMPSEAVIDAVAEAYARALTAAEKADLVYKGAEQISREVRETYPFHPETKHLFAMFKDNPDFRQTRGLMELGSLLLRSVWEGKQEAYLVGPQHFALEIREVGERLADISKLDAAIAKDIYDGSGGAAAQTIDAEFGNRAASEVAALLLTASMSTTGDANRGLRVRDAMAVLVNPLGDEEAYRRAFSLLYDRSQYMHRSPEERYYFDRQVNLNALLREYAKNAPENRLDEIVSRRLEELFQPSLKVAYEELIDGTEGISHVLERIKQRRVLVAVRPDGKLPPDEVQRFFTSVTEKNNIFVLTGERSFEAYNLEDAAREVYATIAAERDVTESNPQRRELMERQQAAQQRLTAAIVGIYDRLLVPFQVASNPPELKSLAIQLTPGTAGGSGEQAIISVLQHQPRKLFTDVTGADFDAIRSKVEAAVWGAHDEVVYADVERRAREQAGAYWLPPSGMRELRDAAIQRGVWEDLGGGRVSRVIKPKVPRAQLTVAKAPSAQDPTVVLEVSTVNASDKALLFYAEDAAATRDGPRVTGGQITSEAATVSVLIVDPARPEDPEIPNYSHERWTNPLPIAHDIEKNGAGERVVTIYAHPSARLRYTLDGTNPRESGAEYAGPFTVAPQNAILSVLATVMIDGAIKFENQERFTIPVDSGPEPTDPWEGLSPTRPTSIESRDGSFHINDRANVYNALDIMKTGTVQLENADLRINSGSGSKQSGAFQVRLTGAAVLTSDLLEVLLKHGHEALIDAGASIVLRFSAANADNFTYLQELSNLMQTKVRVGEVQQ